MPRLPTTTAAAALAARMADSKSARMASMAEAPPPRCRRRPTRRARAPDRPARARRPRRATSVMPASLRVTSTALAPSSRRDFGGGRRDLVVGCRRRIGRVGEFLPVRRDQRGAAIDAVVAAFGIDHHRLARLVGGLDDGADDARGERALGVVGQHHAPTRGSALLTWPISASSLAASIGAAISQSARNRCVEWCSETKRTLRVVCRAASTTRWNSISGWVASASVKRTAGIVVADHADENAARAERDQIARDVAGAADHQSRCA